MAAYQNVPLLGSPAAREHSVLPGEDAIRTVYSQANVVLTSAADNMAALDRVLTEPVMTFAPWSIGRSILEATSLAMWLLQPNIEPLVRVARSMTLRLNHLEEQLTIARTASISQSDISAIESRIESVKGQARRFGLQATTNKKGKLISFGEQLPSGVQLAKQAFGADNIYRMLSASEHNKIWAVQQLSLRLVGQNKLEQYLSFEGGLIIISSSLQWYARAIWICSV